MTDEQLEAGIEAIQAMLAARALGDRAKLIEGTAETVALPAPDPDDKPKRPNKTYGCGRHCGRAAGAQAEEARAVAWLAPDLTMSGSDKWRVAGIGPWERKPRKVPSPAST